LNTGIPGLSRAFPGFFRRSIPAFPAFFAPRHRHFRAFAAPLLGLRETCPSLLRDERRGDIPSKRQQTLAFVNIRQHRCQHPADIDVNSVNVRRPRRGAFANARRRASGRSAPARTCSRLDLSKELRGQPTRRPNARGVDDACRGNLDL
jgi:hypothetical protein